MAISVNQFVQQLVNSSLMSADEVAALIAALPADKRPHDGEELARELVHQKKLTACQAQQVYAGKGQFLVLGNYVILDKLGQGGMGVVFKARHKCMDRLVAIKMIHPNAMKSPAAVQRFYREVKAAARLRHPNIVTAHDAGEHEGMHYLVMEYVEGKDLAQMLNGHGPLPVTQTLQCMIQAARGLEYAHQQWQHQDWRVPAEVRMRRMPCDDCRSRSGARRLPKLPISRCIRRRAPAAIGGQRLGIAVVRRTWAPRRSELS